MNRKLAHSLVAAAFAFAGAIALAAQAKPDFSGVWTMVPEKSDFTQVGGGPAKMTRTITHTDPKMKIVTVQAGGPNGDSTIETTFTTDSKPATNTVNGAPMTTIGKWDGTTLVFASMTQMQGVDVGVEDRYTLSDAGKTLTVNRKIAMADGGFTIKVVLTKTK